VVIHHLLQKVPYLENTNAPTKQGRGLWRVSLIKAMLNQEMYIGLRHYNTMKRKGTKMIKRDRSEWTSVPVPSIVSKELFDKVQAKLEWNRQYYRNPRVIQLLSSLVRCGCCDSSMFAYRRFYKDKRMKVPKVYDRTSYKCNYKYRQAMHAKKNRHGFKKCDNMEIKVVLLEDKVFKMIEEVLIDEKELRKCMDFFKKRTQASQLKLEKQLKQNDDKANKAYVIKKRLVDLYTSGEIEREDYVEKSLDTDNDINQLKLDRSELMKKIPLLHNKDVVDLSIKKFCVSAKSEYKKCGENRDKQREFLLKYVDKIVYYNEKVAFHGFVPVKVGKEVAQLEFVIKEKVLMSDRLNRKNRLKNNPLLQITRKEHDASL